MTDPDKYQYRSNEQRGPRHTISILTVNMLHTMNVKDTTIMAQLAMVTMDSYCWTQSPTITHKWYFSPPQLCITPDYRIFFWGGHESVRAWLSYLELEFLTTVSRVTRHYLVVSHHLMSSGVGDNVLWALVAPHGRLWQDADGSLWGRWISGQVIWWRAPYSMGAFDKLLKSWSRAASLPNLMD